MNSASYSSTSFAPNSFATIYGDSLATGQFMAPSVPLPTSLGGTTVTVTDSAGNQLAAGLNYVSPGQINFLIPSNTALGQAKVTVTTPSGVSISTTILITNTAPGLFSANANGQGVAAALVQRVHPDGTQSIENVATYDSNAKVYVPVPIIIGSDSHLPAALRYWHPQRVELERRHLHDFWQERAGAVRGSGSWLRGARSGERNGSRQPRGRGHGECSRHRRWAGC